MLSPYKLYLSLTQSLAPTTAPAPVEPPLEPPSPATAPVEPLENWHAAVMENIVQGHRK